MKKLTTTRWAAITLLGVVLASPACSDDDNGNGNAGTAGTSGRGGTAGSDGGAGTAGRGGTSGSVGAGSTAGNKATGGTGATDAAIDGDAVASLIDGEIAAVVQTANHGEVQQGRAALAMLDPGPVRDFAQQMIAAHGQAERALTRLLMTLELSEEPNALSRQLMQESAPIVQSIQAAPDAQVERVYIDA
jgi:predicted outer membrane protein